MHRAECRQDKKGVHARKKKLNARTTRAALSPKSWVVYAMHTVPLIMNTRLDLGRTKAELKHLQGCLVSARKQLFKHEKAIACALGTSQNLNPRKPTTVLRGYKEAPKKGPVHGLSFGSKQASRTAR